MGRIKTITDEGLIPETIFLSYGKPNTKTRLRTNRTYDQTVRLCTKINQSWIVPQGTGGTDNIARGKRGNIMTDMIFERAKELALEAYDEMKLSFESNEPKKCEELEKEMYKILRASDLSITDQVHSVKQLLLNMLAMFSA